MANHTAKSMISKSAGPQMAAASSKDAGAPASKPNSSSPLAGAQTAVAAEARRTMIAEAAYYIAEQRGFGSGSEVEDWLRAERQIDMVLSA